MFPSTLILALLLLGAPHVKGGAICHYAWWENDSCSGTSRDCLLLGVRHEE